MTQDTPSLTSLRAFDLVARKGSLSKAAGALNVTRPAVSKQIKVLEETMGCALIERSGPKVSLTDTGLKLAEGLQQGFDMISATTKRVQSGAAHPKAIRILVERDFAASWLAERIGAFLVRHPGYPVEVTAEKNGQLRLDDDFSFRIFYGPPGQYRSDRIIEDHLCDWVDIPLCTPKYAAAHVGPDGHFKNARFLLDKNYNPWPEWFAKTGTPQPDDPAYTSFNDTTLCLSATLAGTGVTIGDSILSLQAIESGQLVVPSRTGIRSREQYTICQNANRTLTRPEAEFLTWLTDTMGVFQSKVDEKLDEWGITVLD